MFKTHNVCFQRLLDGARDTEKSQAQIQNQRLTHPCDYF